MAITGNHFKPSLNAECSTNRKDSVMQSNGSIAVNGMGNVSIGSIVIGNALAHINRGVIYSENMKGQSSFPTLDFARCGVCHRKEVGVVQQIAGVGEIHIGRRCSKMAWMIAKIG
jgi:hypothetical protein